MADIDWQSDSAPSVMMSLDGRMLCFTNAATIKQFLKKHSNMGNKNTGIMSLLTISQLFCI